MEFVVEINLSLLEVKQVWWWKVGGCRWRDIFKVCEVEWQWWVVRTWENIAEPRLVSELTCYIVSLVLATAPIALYEKLKKPWNVWSKK